MPTRRVYPGLAGMKDAGLVKTFRWIFDRLYDTEDRAETLETTVTRQQIVITTQATELARTTRRADTALALASTTPDELTAPPAGEEPPPSGGGGGGSNDTGQGSSGCSQAGASGHVDAGAPLDLTTVGKIVCGTGNEFPALKTATTTLEAREANAEELVKRMIWHLQQHGFTAGRQNNSQSGIRISKDKLTVQVDGVWWAYDVFGSWDDFTTPMSTHMGAVAPAQYVADGGTPD